jgi:hypothetical protein
MTGLCFDIVQGTLSFNSLDTKKCANQIIFFYQFGILYLLFSTDK